MDSVIRDIDTHSGASTSRSISIWKILLGLLILGCLGLGFLYSGEYGLKAWLAFGLLGLLGVLFFVLSLTRSGEGGVAPISIPVSTALERVFARSPHAGVIIEGDRIIRANDSYLEFIEELGLETGRTNPPLPSEVFKNLPEAAKSSIYRLTQIDESDAFEEEHIELISDDGQRNRYLVRVTAHQKQRVWEILDFSQDNSADNQLLAQAPVGLMAILEDGEILTANQVIKDWLGVEDVWDLNFSKLVEHPDGILDAPKDANRTIRFDTRLLTKKNIATPVVVVGSWRHHESGQKAASLAFHGHSSLALSPDEIDDNLMEAVPAAAMAPASALDVPFAMVDLDVTDLREAQIINGNQAFLTLTALEDCAGMKLSEALGALSSGPNLFDSDLKSFLPDQSVDAQVLGRGGRFVSIYPKTDPATGRCRLYLVDISARKVLEDQLAQSQKMQAIGRLVAEIAHDFNNLLAAIRLYTDTLLQRHPIGDPSYPELQQINANGNRAAALVKKLLGYSRKQTIRAENLDVSETLSDMAVTLKQVLGEKVQLEIKHGRALPPIRVDKSQFDTVLMNLAVNARDAMKEQGGGKIIIESQTLDRATLDNPGLLASLQDLGDRRIVVISVIDTGTGMPDEVKDKIFEPFFTTKAQGEGTGLGLATVYGIVQQSGGHLAVDSKLGVGTTFTIYLPESDEADDVVSTPAQKIAPPPKAPSDLAGSGNILFVEDEDSVRIIAAKTLRKRGYTVTEARDGEEAFEIIEEIEEPFDLMISDVVMPGMDGPTLLKKAREQLKDTRIVFISGYAEEEFSDLLAEEPDVTFLPKPFTLVQLAEKVKEQIGEVT